MIIDNKICLEFVKRNRERIISDIQKRSPEDEDWEELYALFNLELKLKYIFSKSVIDTLDTIKVDLTFDCNILLSRKIQDGVLILDKNQMYLFNTIGENLRVSYFKYFPETDSADVLLFSFFLKKNKKVIAQDIEEGICIKFLRSIIYLEFLPTEIKYIKPKEKFGTRRTGKVVNRTEENFIIVTKAWNQEYRTLPNTKYISRAHWGIRWTGKGRAIPKLTFIKASLKGLKKRPEKEIER
ncbi:hypothetical protein [uncultured Croceitalea sp.]|uniref:hypothetical protein n=1 Tax=uncultured Croceitalea sp. TaxID=1798908 RepID=UPI00330593B1